MHFLPVLGASVFSTVPSSWYSHTNVLKLLSRPILRRPFAHVWRQGDCSPSSWQARWSFAPRASLAPSRLLTVANVPMHPAYFLIWGLIIHGFVWTVFFSFASWVQPPTMCRTLSVDFWAGSDHLNLWGGGPHKLCYHLHRYLRECSCVDCYNKPERNEDRGEGLERRFMAFRRLTTNDNIHEPIRW